MAVADAIVGGLVSNLITLLQTDLSLIRGVKEDVEKLSSKLKAIEAVLGDAETSQFTNTSITDWLMKLKDATYHAEDILDAWSYEVREVSRSIPTYLDVNQLMLRLKIAKKLKEMINIFDEIAKQKTDFHLSTSYVAEAQSEFIKKRESSSILSEPKIFGRDEDKRKIIDMLLHGESSRDDIFVGSIVGFGGLGKTTLAQLVYNNERVASCFEVRIWVCVSHPFDVKRVLKQILEAFGVCDLEHLESIQSKVGELLEDKKYLLVLDDVWNENQDEWNKLNCSLKRGAKGSSIMVTTRSPKVASVVGTVKPYFLGGLCDDDCWSLLKHRALGDRGEDEHPNLVAIGKEIVVKCKGLPLAAKSLGSLLESKTEENYWKRIRDHEIWSLEGGEHTVLPVLRLSYNHLPSSLKQCFAYCSIFPKDFEMEKSKLISLWIANGFIQSQGGVELEEIGDDIFTELLRRSFFQDAKEDRFGSIETCKMHDLMHDLACFISVNECLVVEVGGAKDVSKTIKHLTVFLGSPESSISPQPLLTSHLSLRTFIFFEPINFRSFKFSNTLRALGLSNMCLKNLPPSIYDLKHLRYLDLSYNYLKALSESIQRLRNLQMLDLSGNVEITSLPLSVRNLKQLRHLNLSKTSITSLPASIDRLSKLWKLDASGNENLTTLPTSTGNLRNLRYLSFSSCPRITSLPISIGNIVSLVYLDLSSCESITSLPDSVCGLINLQSLILLRCSGLQALPESMRSMSSLRHLDIAYCDRLNKMPVGIGDLTSLQTLNTFVVGSDSVHGSIKELHGLNQLRGVLRIEGLQNVRNAEDAKEANLKSKLYLTELSLRWDIDDSVVQEGNSKEVLGIGLPPNIQALKIVGYRGATCFPQGYLGNLTALTSLRIWCCKELVVFPEGLQKLTSLERIEIRWCSNIQCLPAMGIQGMNSSLLYLEIQGCSSLTSVSKGMQYLKSLQRLGISDCSELEFEAEDFQHLISLRHLELRELPKLRSFPEGIQHLTMLQKLQILECKNLRMLPKGIKNLTSLQQLDINYCHEGLHSRCEKDKGEYWHLISHIPIIWIWPNK